MIVNDMKISQKIKNKVQLRIEKYIRKCEKMNICYKYEKEALSYPFIQMNAKISFLEKI